LKNPYDREILTCLVLCIAEKEYGAVRIIKVIIFSTKRGTIKTIYIPFT